ncbi:MAG: efflux RND transporter periplasmic adaptor subunit [Halieaceae bacterium]|jgi:membrane fusion protein, multidrug efflux system|nr:efflux RND transporter periplasmic adaptor subunit [Halieaceae bacterium]
MKKPASRALVPLFAVLLLLVAIGWMAGLFSNKLAPGLVDSSGAPALSEDRPFALAVHRTENAIETVPGTLQAKHATLISSRIVARIEKIHVSAGDLVGSGDSLISLEKSDVEARSQQAENKVHAVEVRDAEASRNLARATSLHKQGLIAVADLDAARANKDALEAELSAARDAAAEAAATLQFALIRSPIDGRVVDRFAEPGDTATPGTTLLSLYNPLTLRVEAQVREQRAVELTIDQKISIRVPSLDYAMTGAIDELVPAADPGSRSFLIKVRVDYNARLQPGMYAQLLLEAPPTEMTLIPATSVARFGQLDVVWVETDGHYLRRFVKLGRQRSPDKIEVLSGIRAGEKVLLKPPSP